MRTSEETSSMKFGAQFVTGHAPVLSVPSPTPLKPLVYEGVRSVPVEHHLIHPAPVEVGADRPLEVVDEGVHLLVRRSPVEVAVLVRYVAVERRDRQVDKLGHCEPPFTHTGYISHSAQEA